MVGSRRATLHCLTGCAIGEVLGMVIGTALGLSTGATIVLAIVLAFAFGYALTLTPVLRSGVALKAALAVTLAADTVSITVMELVDNSVVLVIPGAMDAGLDTVLFWGSLALSLAIAFVLTVPVNRWLISRGPRPLRSSTGCHLTAVPRHPTAAEPCTRSAHSAALRYPEQVTRFELLP